MFEKWAASRSNGSIRTWHMVLLVALSFGAGFLGGRASATSVVFQRFLSLGPASPSVSDNALASKADSQRKAPPASIAQAGARVTPVTPKHASPAPPSRPSCNAGLATFRDLVLPANLRGLLDVTIEVKAAGTRGEWRLCDASVSIPAMGLPAEVHTYGVRWFDDQHTRVEVERLR